MTLYAIPEPSDQGAEILGRRNQRSTVRISEIPNHDCLEGTPDVS